MLIVHELEFQQPQIQAGVSSFLYSPVCSKVFILKTLLAYTEQERINHRFLTRIETKPQLQNFKLGSPT